jgi:SSS family solute:Na+ symporter
MMHGMHTLDWVIVAAFFVLLVWISRSTNKLTRSVAGFLSSERCAGRYLLTMANAMAFCAAIGIIGQYEGFYRNGLSGQWWGLMMMPVGTVIAMSGWVIYRYRQTRCLTMAQFLEVRYSRRFRIFAGFVAFISGLLNCAVFPMVTAHFLVYFLGLPTGFELFGVTWSTYHLLMLVLVGSGVLLAVAGGQITIMVTDFFAGLLTNVACIAALVFVLYHFGWNTIIDTLAASELPEVAARPDVLPSLDRLPGVSMMHPFKLAKLPDFGMPYFFMMAVMMFLNTGVWQGGAGYRTAARTPHEAKMGNILGAWRWAVIGLATVGMAVAAYVMLWNPAYAADQAAVRAALEQLDTPNLQSQMLVPIAIARMLPPGLLGLFAVFMIGASVSTDDSAYHSWGSTFLQDVVMPFRKTPFSREAHLKYLRWSIVGVGAFAFLFSSLWELRDYIQMWFQITGAIYVGGASCAIVGGLYWRRGTTQGAWAGLLTGSLLSVGGIVFKQMNPDFAIAGRTVNGLHMAVFNAVTAYAVYILTSLATCRKPFNLDRMLHRGAYVDPKDHVTAGPHVRSWIERKLGVSDEFSRSDKVTYYAKFLWMVFWTGAFVMGTAWNVVHRASNAAWARWWAIHLGILFVTAIVCSIWFAIGGIVDVKTLYAELRTKRVNERDDGTVPEDN